jgi:predicted aldo/keto reductase-like oxidoreductase
VLSKLYGRTSTSVSAIGFGGMRFLPTQDVARGAALVRYAHARGINYFDTAPDYCDDRSELIFGQALRELPRASFHVATKSAKSRGAELRAELERSLARLHVDQIDFFHIWCLMSSEDWENRLRGGAVDAARRAQAEGLIRHLVCSSHMPGDDLGRVLESGVFAGVTLGYNAINFPYRASAVRAAADRGLGVVAMNPLAGGLVARNPERFAFLRHAGDPSVVTGALRFLIADPDVTTALVGFSAEHEVDEAVASAERVEEASAAIAARLRQHVEQSFDELCTGCNYCLPCPQSIPISRLMDVYNVRLLGGSDAELLDRYQWHWHIRHHLAADCSDCGDCEPRCTQALPIRERLSQLPPPRSAG